MRVSGTRWDSSDEQRRPSVSSPRRGRFKFPETSHIGNLSETVPVGHRQNCQMARWPAPGLQSRAGVIPESKATGKDLIANWEEKGLSVVLTPGERVRCRRRPQQLLQHRTACSNADTCTRQTTGRPNRLGASPESPRTKNTTRVRPGAVHSAYMDEYLPWRMTDLAILVPQHRTHHNAPRRVGQPGRTHQHRTWGTCRKTARP